MTTGNPNSFANALYGFNTLLGADASPRSRESWNDRLAHWEKAESSSETERIERARRMVINALSESQWMAANGCKIFEQGSFTNRTNTRGESDIDLRVQHPYVYIKYAPGIDAQAAYTLGNYSDTGTTYKAVAENMRAEITSNLISKFGRSAVDASGSKAVKVKGLEGSRAEVDVVPSFRLDHIFRDGIIQGTALLDPSSGVWTFNYPEQHIRNGRLKRQNTGLKFKRVVRCIKRMQSDMLQYDAISKRVPSFLIECLVYNVTDAEFTNIFDDNYGRVKRVLQSIHAQLTGPYVLYMTEINGVKGLFTEGQSWTIQQAEHFVGKALEHMGNM